MKSILLFSAFAVLAVLNIGSCCRNASHEHEIVMKNILNRKSVRQYTQEPVSDADVQTLLKAAMAAPSAKNRQPWRFIVIRERSTLDTLSEGLPFAKMLKHATMAILVCGDTIQPDDGKYNLNWEHDCSAAAQNILLAAESLGLGAVWSATYPNEDRIILVKSVLGMPEHVMPLCIIPVGHPAAKVEPRDKWNPDNIHYEKW